MKKQITILAMLLIAATAYNQTSRRPANSNKTAQRSNREASSTNKRDASKSSQRQSGDAIAKTKRTDRRTYHYDHNTPVKRTTTHTRTKDNTQRNRGNSTNVTRTSRSQKTTQSREANRTYSNVNSAYKDANRKQNHMPRETKKVTSTRPAVQHHREYKSQRVYRERHSVVHNYHHKPAPKAYRAKYYAYRRPAQINIIWTPVMHRHYIRMYPMVKYWYYSNGYNIAMVSAYDAEYYRGEVRTVYGRVTEVFYSRSTDEYFLYFGLHYPYQDFTVVLPGYVARRYSSSPQRYFDQRHLAVTGLITTFNGEPEIVVKESFQVHLY